MVDHAKFVKPNWLPANQLKHVVIDVVLIATVILLVGASIFLQTILPEDNWFMRSGAVMALIGAVLEYRHGNFQRSFDMASIKWASGVGGPVIFEPRLIRVVIGYLAHVLVVVGTLIAAYGDKFAEMVS